jgi:peptidoglycan/LPS O-acetylase OafA/YrhL
MKQELTSLTSIRGLAALWVLGFHFVLWPLETQSPLPRVFLSMGYVAVDVFFILSGFILSMRYERLTPADSFWFLRKRLARLYPLHFAVMAVLGLGLTVAPLLHLPLNSDSSHSGGNFFLVLALLQPYVNWLAGWNEPSWSLSIELFCCVFFPLLILFTRPRSTKVKIALWAILLVTEPIILGIYGDSIRVPGAVLRGFSGFYLGILFYQLKWKPSRVAGILLETLSILAIVASLLFSSEYLVPAATGFLLVRLKMDQGPTARVLSTRVLYWLGRVSFSLYLIQAPVLLVTRNLARRALSPHFTDLDTPLVSYCYALVVTLLLLGFAEIAFRLIEQPSHRWARSLVRPTSRRNKPTESNIPVPTS